MRRCVLILFLLTLTVSVAAAEWVPLTSSTPLPPVVTVLSDTLGETIFRVDVPGYFLDAVPVGGALHSRILLPKSPRLLNAGEPELPFVAVAIAISPEGTPVAEILESDSRTVALGPYLPSKGSLSRAVDPDSVPFTFSPTYGKDAAYPATGCEAGEPYLLRNLRGTAVAVYPFRVNPVLGTLSVSPSITVRVRTSGEGGSNVLTAKAPECPDFQQIYADHFANVGAGSWSYIPVKETGGLLIITNDSFYDSLLPLVYWKRQKGVPTEIVKLSTVGSTSAQVKSFIQDRYNLGSLAYVLLVGDSAFMPFPTGTAGNVVGNAADPMYALLSGTDSYPDIVVSRFPAQTATEAATMANRVIRYEKTPQAGASWYGTAAGIASSEGSPTDGQRMDWLRTDLMGYGYGPVDQIYDPGATAAQVSAALNAGRGLVNYIGHGSETYWVTSYFDVADVYALNNADMVPFIFDVACVNGRFDRGGGDCFAEAWLKAGTPAAPKGALGIYASSTNQDWVPPCDAQGESVDLLVADRYHTFGTLCFNGVMKGLDMYPGTTGQQLFQQWHIFGDGSQVVSTDAPVAMAVTHAAGLPDGAMSFDVSVPGVNGALCALYDEASHTLFGSATTLAGEVSIPLDAPPSGLSSLTLTVTAFNRTPYIATVQVGGNYLHAAASATPTAGAWPLPVSFTATAAGGTAPYTYQWTFGDGATSTLQNPGHTYGTAGTFPVALTVKDSAGATAKDSHVSISVTAPPCTLTCSASAPASGRAGDSVEFGASSSGTVGCTGSATYSWSFGDGATSAQKNPRHTYAAAGTFTWTVTVSMAGQVCSKTGTIAVAPGCVLTCQASASPAAGEAPLTVAFSASATAADCSGAPAYSWTFGDGFTSAQQNPNHTYAAAGSYSWGLTVTADGQACTQSGTVTVEEPCSVTCEASALPASGDAPLTVSFSASATPTNCQGQPSFGWSFGDGTSASSQNPSHTYAAAGAYGWTLTVTADGRTCSKAGTVEVSESCAISCAADVAASATAGSPVPFRATAQATHCSATPTYSWSFGDGAVSGDAEASHTYAAGSYGWTLTVTVDGRTCSKAGTIEVVEPCALSCSAAATPSVGDAPLAVNFNGGVTATGCDGNPGFAWSFGDGALSTVMGPAHTYAGPGSYLWSFTVTMGGKTCTQSGTVTVNAPCALECEASVPAQGKTGAAAAFSATASASHCVEAVTYAWDFGDGTSSSEQNPSHAYASVGEFTWSLTVSSGGVTCGRSGVVAVSQALPGDQDGDGVVSIGEVQIAVNMFLGILPPAGGVDCDGDGVVSVGELQKVINAFLGMPSACP